MSSHVENPPSRNVLEKWDRALQVVEGEGVRLYHFLPSGMAIRTVVGRECEYLVHCPSSKSDKPYCGCDDFYYRVLSGKAEECYHLVAARKALGEERYTVVEMKDNDFPGFVKRLLVDMFRNIS